LLVQLFQGFTFPSLSCCILLYHNWIYERMISNNFFERRF
jgi:hypothetical protein